MSIDHLTPICDTSPSNLPGIQTTYSGLPELNYYLHADSFEPELDFWHRNMSLKC